MDPSASTTTTIDQHQTTSPDGGVSPRRRAGGTRYSSPTRFPDHHREEKAAAAATSPAPGLRLRADSTGSTQNAFGPMPPKPPPTPHRDPRASHKRAFSPKRQTNKKTTATSRDVEDGGYQVQAPMTTTASGLLSGDADAIKALQIQQANSMFMNELTHAPGTLLGLSSDVTSSIRDTSSKGRPAAKAPVTNDFHDQYSDDEDEVAVPSQVTTPPESKTASGPVDDSLWGRITYYCDPTEWLTRDVQFHPDTDIPFFSDYDQHFTAAGLVRTLLFNPIAPEFTSLQQFSWALIIGIVMGFYTAAWKTVIETGVEFVWGTIPEVLLELGVFTELDGLFPLYHYMWICPMIFGSVLSYIFVILPVKIPGQNEWIHSLHTRGVQDHRTFWPLWILSTLGMLSGLSLGPELPLVLTAGMFGSWLGVLCQQSMLQARVLNLTAASAAVGGFFGFPMAGALFVLELPHRMGLQYFEALSPATISSIVAVITNRLLVRDDVTGYFKYPFLAKSLPSHTFTHAIFYGLFGAGVGILYALGVLELKHWVHEWFHAPHAHDDHPDHDEDLVDLPMDDDGSVEVKYYNAEQHKLENSEKTPLVAKSKKTKALEPEVHSEPWYCTLCCVLAEEPKRAAAAGALAGALVGLTAMFVPHTLFWGESQLQNLIDKGRTPLPIFGQGDEPTADMLALGYCLLDPEDEEAAQAGFNLGCSALISIAKTFVIGLSLGTGIIGGHFWGPLFVGCAMSHFLSDAVHIFDDTFGFGSSLAEYPCLIILCTMGAAHVVSFRAHIAIMLILTLTISAFSPEDNNVLISTAGDYSAVFPLLVISVFISLMASRQLVFYKEQRSRGDITAVPEVLCEPGVAGRPLVAIHEPNQDDDDDDFFDNQPQSNYGGVDKNALYELHDPADEKKENITSYRAMATDLTQEAIEAAFQQQSYAGGAKQGRTTQTSQGPDLSSSRLDELLSIPLESEVKKDAVPVRQASKGSTTDSSSHRRTQSAPGSKKLEAELQRRDTKRFETGSTGKAERSNSFGRGSSFVRIHSFGELQEHQPPLLEQARIRAASAVLTSTMERDRSPDTSHRRYPSMPSTGNSGGMTPGSGRHSRKNSSASGAGDPLGGALSLDDIERSFQEALQTVPTTGILSNQSAGLARHTLK